MNVESSRGNVGTFRRVWLSVAAVVLVVVGSVSVLPFQTPRQAAAAPPILQPAPVSPPVSTAAGSAVSLSFDGGPSLQVTVVEPGVAV
jgi:hypothetical protein